MLKHKEKIIIVLSLEKGIYQHDIYSWQVIGTDLIKVEKNTQTSEEINETLTNWLDSTTVEKRKIFIDSVFEVFYSTEANTFGEISSNLSTNIPKILKKYNEISKEDKKVITEMIKIFAKAYFGVLRERESEKFHELKEHYKIERKNKL